jgi:hypothetical protein
MRMYLFGDITEILACPSASVIYAAVAFGRSVASVSILAKAVWGALSRAVYSSGTRWPLISDSGARSIEAKIPESRARFLTDSLLRFVSNHSSWSSRPRARQTPSSGRQRVANEGFNDLATWLILISIPKPKLGYWYEPGFNSSSTTAREDRGTAMIHYPGR